MPAGSFFIPSGQASSNLISYLLEPTTNDNLVTWGYLDGQVQLTDSPEEIAARRAQVQAQLDAMTPEQRAAGGARLERQLGQNNQGRVIPMYRVMKKTNIPGILVEPFNQFEARRYIR